MEIKVGVGSKLEPQVDGLCSGCVYGSGFTFR